ncbi:MAG: sulfatase-like hydrolase/transferase [Steroidobacteraceae bacterium]|nr:sulfatase-like hydrolase/transferase [Nevskiaceae bacterium]MCP5359311.1 sulfatase-like hydrolase/transferase [Nevskiaceae bacterium]MCP5471753.1 sulfatase-like hydrolase/transferase [Nevskiaceae bacterium]
MTAAPRSTRLDGLLLALGASLLVLVLSFWQWMAQWGDTLGSNRAFRSLHQDSLLGSALGTQLALFVLAQLSLHLGFGLACWGLARAARSAWPDYPATQRTWVTLWLLLGIFWVLIANAALFPNSTFGDHLFHVAQARIGGVTIHVVVSVLVGSLLLLTVGTAAWRLSRRARAGTRVGWAAAVGLGLVASSAAIVLPDHYTSLTPAPKNGTERPHVILLGLDSLRCDFAAPIGKESTAPNIDRFLSRAARFTDAMTPLARTYPSWISILTGKHPHTTGAFVNLLHRDQMALGDNLPEAMRRNGWRTAYAIDEVRFSNIDESYGFDQTITPPMGAADFLIGMVNDAPLSNVIVNTRLGRLLFPYSHANRAAATLYDPDTFVERLDRELNFDKPTFLALHLTLAHWPYTWASARRTDLANAEHWVAAHYTPAVRRLDQQFADVLAVLERKGALRNAIVVLLSDHGEAIGLPGDSPFAMSGPIDDPYAWPTITGHGTSVLSPHQYRVVLAIRGFGTAAQDFAATHDISVPVSLEDLAPTLNEWLSLDMHDQFDGRSLLPILNGISDPAMKSTFQSRIRFTETEFNPRGFLPGQQATSSDLADAIRVYEIDPETGRMNIRRNERAKLLRQRQYAAVRGNSMVAAVPGYYTEGFRFIYINPERGPLPRNLSERPDPEIDPTATQLWDALFARFAESFSDHSTM